MKLIKLSIFNVFLLSLMLISCSEESKIPNSRVDIPMSRSESEIVCNQNEFSLRLYKEVAKLSDENLCISPLSLSMTLSMIANGAEGSTREQILEGLGFSRSDLDEVNAFNARLCSNLGAVDHTSDMLIANSIWFDYQMNIHESFLKNNSTSYAAELFNIEFGTQTSKNEMNKWCKEKTKGMIPAFLDKPLTGVAAVLNALYFKGIWKEPFDKSKTDKSNFYNNGEGLVQVPMMEGEIKCSGSYDTKGANWILIPYGNGAFHMIVVQPTHIAKDALSNYLNSLSFQEFDEMLQSLTAISVKLKMPKFEINSTQDLKIALQNLGITDLFNGEGNFSKMCEDKLCFTVQQKTKMYVDEDGTQTASVTKGEANLLAPAPIVLEKGRLTIDHPFLYMIREVSTGSIIYIGHVNSL